MLVVEEKVVRSEGGVYDRLPLTSHFRTNQEGTIIMSSVMFILGSRGDFSYCLIILELSISVNIHRHQRSTPEKEGIVSNRFLQWLPDAILYMYM